MRAPVNAVCGRPGGAKAAWSRPAAASRYVPRGVASSSRRPAAWPRPEARPEKQQSSTTTTIAMHRASA
ncbi:hypothetical protein [Thermopolyspora flexuosa]|uniref:Uncharacterized protein n=1 Tax=Thermopolyspora flexuosa TaxID=103836 RepID=A0A543IUN5_9ACTN|nr:hypothetical protein [Thermopolyspora flexuosa]TQM74292.1 hypothetical protein FHX40_0960 [Thermopolyspora flexuosa]